MNKKIVYALIIFGLLALSVPLFSARNGCNATMATTTCKNICDDSTQVVWSLAMSTSADSKFTTALAKNAGWTATVVCTQAMVDLAQCTAPQLGTQVTNPITEVQAAKAEFKRHIKEDYIKSLDAEVARADGAALTASELAAITDPATGN